MISFISWIKNIKKLKNHYPKFYNNNSRLYSKTLIDRFNLICKVNAKELL